MRRLTLCVVLTVLGCVTGCRNPDTTPETRITTKDGKVTVLFPHEPTESKEGGDSMYILESRDGKTALLFNPIALPIDLTDKALVKKVLDGARDGGIRAAKGKLVSTRDVNLGKYPGQTFDAEIPLGAYRKGLYLTGQDMIQITVLGPKEFVDGPVATKFLDSLKIEE
jgi:hypothetical protein